MMYFSICLFCITVPMCINSVLETEASLNAEKVRSIVTEHLGEVM